MKKSILKGLILSLALATTGCVSPSVPTQPDANLPTVQTLKTISDITEIGFEWVPASASNVAGYYLYRSNPNENNGKMKIAANIKDKFASHYVDAGLAPETTYSYEMRTYNDKGQTSNPGVVINATTKPLLDSVPFLQALTNLPERVKLIWRPHPDATVASYIIERSDVAGESWSKIAEVKGRLNAEYIDADVKSGKTYKYRIFVKTVSGVVSKPSKIVDSTTKRLPDKVSNIQATKDLPKKIVITWDGVSGEDFAYYKIYSASSKIFPYSYLAKTTQNSYEDLINDNGETRYYKITIVDTDGLESPKPESPIVGSTLSAPNAPSVTSIVSEGGAVSISWNAVDRAQKYTLERSGGDGGRNFTEISDTSFIDSSVKFGLKYKYGVIAIDEYGIASQASDKVEVTVQ